MSFFTKLIKPSSRKKNYQFFNLKIITKSWRIAVTLLAIIIAKLPIKNPYINQSKTPTNIIKYIVRETPWAFFSLYILKTWGINDEVVRIAAIIQLIHEMDLSYNYIYDFTGYYNNFLRSCIV